VIVSLSLSLSLLLSFNTFDSVRCRMKKGETRAAAFIHRRLCLSVPSNMGHNINRTLSEHTLRSLMGELNPGQECEEYKACYIE
jgi:hypothetical protein